MTSLRICIDIDDLARAIDFYTHAIGLRLGRRFGDAWVELLGASAPIDLLAKAAGSSPSLRSTMTRNYGRHWTPVHLDFVVTELDAAVRRAQAAGAILESGIQEQKWGRMALMADPFGHGFCFLEFRGRGYDEMMGD